ncbi:hypothetical protein SAMN05421686_10719 [Thalassolituus maritimus]|uniref:Uncharacterized protein n=1 Tax=Thalassolituus maritimus TaxID=484498 RepID=A0A1N7NH96_9GAMM|nr:hypothetical protein SAMN05421686_10719 [Thalassolituus maritimus]
MRGFLLPERNTATRVGELGAPVRCPPLGTTFFYKEPRYMRGFLLPERNTVTRVGELGAPVRCPPLCTTYSKSSYRNVRAFLLLTRKGSTPSNLFDSSKTSLALPLRPCKSDPIRFVRLFQKPVQKYTGFFYCLRQTTATYGEQSCLQPCIA